jgi:hypothetical protein
LKLTEAEPPVFAASMRMNSPGIAPPTATTPAATGVKTVSVIALYRPVSLTDLRLPFPVRSRR